MFSFLCLPEDVSLFESGLKRAKRPNDQVNILLGVANIGVLEPDVNVDIHAQVQGDMGNLKRSRKHISPYDSAIQIIWAIQMCIPD